MSPVWQVIYCQLSSKWSLPQLSCCSPITIPEVLFKSGCSQWMPCPNENAWFQFERKCTFKMCEHMLQYVCGIKAFSCGAEWTVTICVTTTTSTIVLFISFNPLEDLDIRPMFGIIQSTTCNLDIHIVHTDIWQIKEWTKYVSKVLFHLFWWCWRSAV